MAPPPRKANRLKGYDYNQAGYYFVTLCTKNRTHYLGYVENGQIKSSWYGQIARRTWQQIPEHYPGVEIDEFVIMPNHIHGIIIIHPVPVATEQCSVATAKDILVEAEHCSASTRDTILGGAEHHSVGTAHCAVPTGAPTKHYGLLSKVVKSFKNAVTRQIRLHMEDHEFAWQRSFYDHIIRDEDALNNIRVYIKNNPLQWELDQDNPENLYM